MTWCQQFAMAHPVVALFMMVVLLVAGLAAALMFLTVTGILSFEWRRRP